MKIKIISLLLCLHAGLLSTGFSQTAATSRLAQSVKSGHGLSLAAHGVGLNPPELTKFLESGFPPGVNRSKLPDKPADKSQLAVDAMAILGGDASRQALPILMRIASLDIPAGVASLVEMDVQKLPAEKRDEARNRALRILQFNAINALGLIGNPLALPAARAVFSAEESPSARIQYALTLACLGDPSGMDFLISVIQLQNRRESVAAAKVFYYITGQNFSYTESTPIKARKTRAKMCADWWKANRQTFQPAPQEITKRRLEPENPYPSNPQGIRDFLKVASNYFDFNNTLHSREARDRLSRSGRSINNELQRVASDEMEDLDVRMEAMNWYYEANRADARAFLKKLKRDENPEIVDKANSLILQIEEKVTTP
ncbi:MAG: hypothetical protein WCK47_01850 [bacterium]